MIPCPQNAAEWNELFGRVCNEDLEPADLQKFGELLAENAEVQKLYIYYLDLHAAVRLQAQSLSDDDFVLLEVQAALNSPPPPAVSEATLDELAPCSVDAIDGETSPLAARMSSALARLRHLHRGRLLWPVAAAVMLVGAWLTARTFQSSSPRFADLPPSPTEATSAQPEMAGVAKLSGAVGARWAGPKLELPEDEVFEKGQRLELVEGLAELRFRGGARVVLQGPTILQIRDDDSAWASVGRIAAVAPRGSSTFVLHTVAADLKCRDAEYGAEVDVDGSIVTQVYSGHVDVSFNRPSSPSSPMLLAGGQGVRIDAASGSVEPLTQPSGLTFVRYLPQRELMINLADVVAGGDGLSKADHRGIGLVDGRPVDDYGAPVHGDGQYHRAQGIDFVDGVFVPDGSRGPTQVDSLGRQFVDFPTTSGDCWGGAIMVRRPKEEKSLPFMRLECHGDDYGYVNWLDIASKPEELSPQGYGLIGMHSNCGITFDLNAVRARHPGKSIARFSALVGNLESKPEAYIADAWILVDGKLRYHRRGFSREDGPAAIEVPLSDQDRFLALVSTDAGGKTAYDWVAFGDAVIEMTNADGLSAEINLSRRGAVSSSDRETATARSRREARHGILFDDNYRSTGASIQPTAPVERELDQSQFSESTAGQSRS